MAPTLCHCPPFSFEMAEKKLTTSSHSLVSPRCQSDSGALVCPLHRMARNCFLSSNAGQQGACVRTHNACAESLIEAR
eukprot:10283383-Karenia_brevis.AAC.1